MSSTISFSQSFVLWGWLLLCHFYNSNFITFVLYTYFIYINDKCCLTIVICLYMFHYIYAPFRSIINLLHIYIFTWLISIKSTMLLVDQWVSSSNVPYTPWKNDWEAFYVSCQVSTVLQTCICRETYWRSGCQETDWACHCSN